MILKCHASKRFLAKINIEEYIEELEKIGVSQQTPIIIEIPCRTCKQNEIYEIYKDKQVYRGSYKRGIS